MELEVINIEGKGTSRKIELADDIFAIEPNDHVLYLAVKHYLASQRQGTHKTKERGEVKGSTRKIKRQKGTGTARAGDIKNPLFRGGGRVFGPKPHKYITKLNKKENQLARKSALSYKTKADALKVIEDFTLESPKTKSFYQILKNIGVEGKKSLFVIDGKDEKVYLSARNIPRTRVTMASSLNVYDIMHADVLIISEKSVKTLDELLRKN